ncbi:unnamed protein product [Penicillium discolor]
MGFARPAGAFRTLLGQLILLTQIVLIAQAHPYSNNSIFPLGSEDNLHHVVARATHAEFTALPNSPRIRVHKSCMNRWSFDYWDATIEELKIVANYGAQATQMTLDMINNNMNNPASSAKTHDRSLHGSS